MLLEAEKNVLIDLFYSTLEILNILACSANFLVVYICTVKICGEYLAVLSHVFEFTWLTLWLTLIRGMVSCHQTLRVALYLPTSEVRGAVVAKRMVPMQNLLACVDWVLDGPPWPETVVFYDSLGTAYAPVSKILSVNNSVHKHIGGLFAEWVLCHEVCFLQ